MKLTIDQFVQLQSAGFTDRQITTLQEKFYCLLETVPLPDPVHVQNIESLSQQLSAEKAKVAHLVEEILRADSWLSAGNSNKALAQVRVLAGLTNESYLNCIGRSAAKG